MKLLRAETVDLDRIRPLRERYREEMGCQIVHDAIHERPGWSREYRLRAGREAVGYGSVAVAGPWREQPTIYEFYVLPEARCHLFELFETLIVASGSEGVEVQSNDRLATVALHAMTRDVRSESILFEDGRTTNLDANGTIVRPPLPDDFPDIADDQMRWHAVLELDGQAVAKGGILHHYNPPYGDVYMDVAEPYRQRGFGSYLVQELKRICYEGGRVPGARCSPNNEASRRTLQRAGFAPCGHILSGRLK